MSKRVHPLLSSSSSSSSLALYYALLMMMMMIHEVASFVVYLDDYSVMRSSSSSSFLQSSSYYYYDDATTARGRTIIAMATETAAAALETTTRTTTTTTTTLPCSSSSMPTYSPATNLLNRIYHWRNYNIRYQVSGPEEDADHILLLVHGLFVNSDHWRKVLTGLQPPPQQSPTFDTTNTTTTADNLPTTTKQTKTYRVYALDLLGSGWSSKPSRFDPKAMALNGENGRFMDCNSTCYYDYYYRENNNYESNSESQNNNNNNNYNGKRSRMSTTTSSNRKVRSASTLENVPLGTSLGGNRIASRLELRHPLRSPYNFYTWAEQLADFTRDVIHADLRRQRQRQRRTSSSSSSSTKKISEFNDSDDNNNITTGINSHEDNNNKDDDDNDDNDDDDGDLQKVTLISNSIGTMSSLQSIIDEPQLFNGIFIINPNFRELHMAEVPCSIITMPLVRTLQSILRSNGHGLFKTLATPTTVKTILQTPYSVVDAIDDELISVLLDPLLTEGADEVVFDTLSYSAGPLPEQQLCSIDFPSSKDCPVWVAYGNEDPWTPAKRVEKLGKTMVRRRHYHPASGGVSGSVGCSEGNSIDVDEMAVERVIGLEGAGHCPHDEVPEMVNKLILEFLDRLER